MKPHSWYRMVLILTLVVMITACSRELEKTFTTEANTITITSPSHEVQAITRNDLSGSFVVVKMESVLFPESLSYIDASLTLIGLEHATAEKQQVMELLADAASVVRTPQQIRPQHVRVIASSGQALKSLEKVRDLAEKNLHPVIDISMRGIRVMEILYNGSPVYLTGDAGIQYLLDRVEIQENNFR
ncbi:MAG TPA: hypothetical protein ENN34_02215 [Deltaproteobacteria bacterium]|nr:hypothetical protein [Deltaproteobacteria bacterium]